MDFDVYIGEISRYLEEEYFERDNDESAKVAKLKKCYDLSYKLRLHLGKDLRENKRCYKSGKV